MAKKIGAKCYQIRVVAFDTLCLQLLETIPPRFKTMEKSSPICLIFLHSHFPWASKELTCPAVPDLKKKKRKKPQTFNKSIRGTTNSVRFMEL